jgi:hypothetical protein
MPELTIYVPRTPTPHSLANIKPGSALVGLPAADRTVVYYEGNVYGADNLRTFAQRLNCAADRLDSRYPTIARISVNNEDLIDVGTVRKDLASLYWGVDDIREPELLQHWLGSEPLRNVFEQPVAFVRSRLWRLG